VKLLGRELLRVEWMSQVRFIEIMSIGTEEHWFDVTLSVIVLATSTMRGSESLIIRSEKGDVCVASEIEISKSSICEKLELTIALQVFLSLTREVDQPSETMER